MGEIANCKICQAQCELRESHIFPRCFIKFVREDEGTHRRFYEMHERASTLVQDGPKERLLCEDCEQKIGRYEKYFKEAVHLSRHSIGIAHNNSVVTIHGLDYRKAKLFLVSLIYRMGVASLLQFKSIALGKHEEVLRTMIVTEDPGRSDYYPVAAMVPLIEGKVEECVLCTPSVCYRDDATAYHMIVGGIMYSFFFPSSSAWCDAIHPLNAYLNERWFLNETGTWVMPLIDIQDIPFLGVRS